MLMFKRVGDPRLVISTATFHANVGGSFPGHVG